jgi:hypothetical protein
VRFWPTKNYILAIYRLLLAKVHRGILEFEKIDTTAPMHTLGKAGEYEFPARTA